LRNYNKYNNEIFIVSIEWQKERFSYLFEQYVAFYEEFVDQVEALKVEQEGIHLANQSPSLPKKDYDLLIETIAASDEYFKNHTQPGMKLDRVIHSIIENETEIDPEKYHIPMYRLKRDVELVFNKKYYKKKARETSKHIKAMKKQGKTKKAIIAELEITEGMFDKLAHA
jgi:hypothetical protein